MKKRLFYLFFILIVFLNIAGAEQYPSYTGWVNDYANVISKDAKSNLTQIIGQIEKQTGSEIAVATLDKIPEGENIDSYAVKLFAKWGIGKEEKDNGILVILAVSERKVRIEVGYGLEGILPDGRIGNIIDEKILPYFKKGDYNNGLVSGTIAIGQIIAKDKGVTLEFKDIGIRQLPSEDDSSINWFGLLFIAIFVFIFFSRVFWPGFFLFGGPYRKRGYWSGGGFGGSSGGFGGFGGFGGGLSGGGGASRGW